MEQQHALKGIFWKGRVENLDLLAKQAGDLREVDLGAFCASDRHEGQAILWERLDLTVW